MLSKVICWSSKPVSNLHSDQAHAYNMAELELLVTLSQAIGDKGLLPQILCTNHPILLF